MEALLGHLLWNALEATILAAGIWLASRVLKVGPSLRHALWLLVLAKLLLPPIAVQPAGLSALSVRGAGIFGLSPPALEIAGTAPPASPHLRPCGLEPSVLRGIPVGSAGAEELEEAGRLENDAPGLEAPEPVAAGAAWVAPAAPQQDLDAPGYSPDAESSRGDEPARSNAPASLSRPEWLAWIWLAGVVLAAGWQVSRIAVFRARLGRLAPASIEIREECERMARELGLRRTPPVRVTDRPISPLVWAFGRPTVILPPGLTRNDTLRSVLCHELAHIKRLDHWISWIELLSSCVYWWLPTFHLLRREMRRAADLAADALAVRELGSRRTYAESLFRMVDFLGSGRVPATMLGRSLARRESLERRLQMIMKEPLETTLSWKSWLAVVLLSALVLPASPDRLSGQGAAVAPVAPPGEAAEAAEAAPELNVTVEPSTGVAEEPSVEVEEEPALSVSAPATNPAPTLPGAAEGSSAPPSTNRAPGRVRHPAPTAPSLSRSVGVPVQATTPADRSVEKRLSDLEKKLELVLIELQNLRSDGYGAPRPTTGTRAVTTRRAVAGGMSGPPQIVVRSSRSSPEPFSPEHAVQPEETPRAMAVSGLSRRPEGAGRPLTAEQRARIDELNRHFEKQIADIRKAHDEAIRRVLDESEELRLVPVAPAATEPAAPAPSSSR